MGIDTSLKPLTSTGMKIVSAVTYVGADLEKWEGDYIINWAESSVEETISGKPPAPHPFALLMFSLAIL